MISKFFSVPRISFSSGGLWNLWRLALGAYFSIYAFLLFPHVEFLAPGKSQTYLFIFTLGSFLLGFGRSSVIGVGAVLLLMGELLDHSFHPLIRAPEMPFLAWTLIVVATWRFTPRDRDSDVAPKDLVCLIWIAFGIGHFVPGYAKLEFGDPNWYDGTALSKVIQSTFFGREWARDFLLDAPDLLMRLFTYYTLIVELAGVLAVFFLPGKRIWLFLTILLHFGILVTLDIPQISWGVILALSFLLPNAIPFGRRCRESTSGAPSLDTPSV